MHYLLQFYKYSLELNTLITNFELEYDTDIIYSVLFTKKQRKHRKQVDLNLVANGRLYFCNCFFTEYPLKNKTSRVWYSVAQTINKHADIIGLNDVYLGSRRNKLSNSSC